MREGFAVVAFGWLVVGLLGALPFWLSGQIPSFTDAVFESISGFTTTGASILPDIESRTHGTLFWRALTHWLGGMGIVLLALAILPLLGVGGMQLFRAEVPGPVAERLTPRIRETAKLLWGVYLLLTVLEVRRPDDRRHGALRCGLPLVRHHGHRRFQQPQRQRGGLRLAGGGMDHHRLHVPGRRQTSRCTTWR